MKSKADYKIAPICIPKYTAYGKTATVTKTISTVTLTIKVNLPITNLSATFGYRYRCPTVF